MMREGGILFYFLLSENCNEAAFYITKIAIVTPTHRQNFDWAISWAIIIGCHVVTSHRRLSYLLCIVVLQRLPSVDVDRYHATTFCILKIVPVYRMVASACRLLAWGTNQDLVLTWVETLLCSFWYRPILAWEIHHPKNLIVLIASDFASVMWGLLYVS